MLSDNVVTDSMLMSLAMGRERWRRVKDGPNQGFLRPLSSFHPPTGDLLKRVRVDLYIVRSSQRPENKIDRQWWGGGTSFTPQNNQSTRTLRRGVDNFSI